MLPEEFVVSTRVEPVPSPVLRWLARLLLVAAIAAVTLWVHLFEFNGTNTWDSALFLSMGKLLGRGLLLYRDLWDTKPPGIFLYQRAVFSMLPVEVWSLRLTDYLLYVGAGVLFYRLCAVEAHWPLAFAATAIWLFCVHHPRFNIAGFYTEEYSSMAAVAAVAAATRYWRRGGFVWVAWSGVATATAVLFKHPGVACAVPVALLISGRRPVRALPLYALCAALPVLLVVAYFWWHGALDAFLDCQFLHLLVQHRVTQAGGPGLVARLAELRKHSAEHLGTFHAVVWPGLFGAVVCLLRPNRFRLAALGWLVADLALIAEQKYYYEHYYIQIFASATLVGVLGAAWLLQARPHERWYVAAPRLAIAMALVAIAWPRLQALIASRQPSVAAQWAALRAGPEAWPHHPGGVFEAEIGNYLKERTAPDDRIFIYETGTAIATYWTAERLPASRYLFSVTLFESAARQAEQLAELERTRPAYAVVTGDPVFRHFSPFLLANYTLAAVKIRDYRVEIWARNDLIPFASGVGAGVVEDTARGGLALAESAAPADAPLAELPEARRGTWTSPVIEVIGGAGELRLDWRPRADLATNPTGVGMPSAEASATQPPDDPKAVLGTPTRSGRWSIAPRSTSETLTLRLGAEAVADHILMRGALDPADTPASRLQILAATDGDFTPLVGDWAHGSNDNWTYRFAARPLSALRIVATPATPPRALGLERVQVPAVGMGIAVRYRTGPTPDLAAAPWVAVEDEEGPLVVAAQRYVQIQCEMWSRYAGRGPVLRAVQIGRLRFDLAGTRPAESPLRTARAGSAPQMAAKAAAPGRRSLDAGRWLTAEQAAAYQRPATSNQRPASSGQGRIRKAA